MSEKKKVTRSDISYVVAKCRLPETTLNELNEIFKSLAGEYFTALNSLPDGVVSFETIADLLNAFRLFRSKRPWSAKSVAKMHEGVLVDRGSCGHYSLRNFLSGM